jgi:hypothetical protein
MAESMTGAFLCSTKTMIGVNCYYSELVKNVSTSAPVVTFLVQDSYGEFSLEELGFSDYSGTSITTSAGSCGPFGVGSLLADPGFIGGISVGAYSLKNISYCIGKGTNSALIHNEYDTSVSKAPDYFSEISLFSRPSIGAVEG